MFHSLGVHHVSHHPVPPFSHVQTKCNDGCDGWRLEGDPVLAGEDIEITLCSSHGPSIDARAYFLAADRGRKVAAAIALNRKKFLKLADWMHKHCGDVADLNYLDKVSILARVSTLPGYARRKNAPASHPSFFIQPFAYCLEMEEETRLVRYATTMTLYDRRYCLPRFEMPLNAEDDLETRADRVTARFGRYLQDHQATDEPVFEGILWSLSRSGVVRYWGKSTPAASAGPAALRADEGWTDSLGIRVPGLFDADRTDPLLGFSRSTAISDINDVV